MLSFLHCINHDFPLFHFHYSKFAQPLYFLPSRERIRIFIHSCRTASASLLDLSSSPPMYPSARVLLCTIVNFSSSPSAAPCHYIFFPFIFSTFSLCSDEIDILIGESGHVVKNKYTRTMACARVALANVCVRK